MKSIKWELTKKCNMCCNHCYYYDNGNPSSDLDLQTAKTIIDNLKRMGYSNIILCAKEPFLYDYIFELLYYIKEKDIRVSLNTNGTSMKDHEIDRLINDNLVSLFTVGLDGICEESNSYLRRKGSFDITLNTIATINEIRGKKKIPKIAINYTLNNNNISEASDIIPFFAGLKINILNVSYVSSIGNAEKNDTNSELNNLSSVYDTIAEHYKKYDTPFHLNLVGCPPFLLSYFNIKYGLRFKVRYSLCSLGDRGFFIDSEGIVHGCEMLSNFDNQESLEIEGPKVDIKLPGLDYIFNDNERDLLKSIRNFKYEYCEECELRNACEPCPIVPQKTIQRPFLISCYESKEKLLKEREAFVGGINNDDKVEFYKDIKHELEGGVLTITVINHSGVSKVKYKVNEVEQIIYCNLVRFSVISEIVRNVEKQLNGTEPFLKKRIFEFILFFAEKGYLRLSKSVHD